MIPARFARDSHARGFAANDESILVDVVVLIKLQLGWHQAAVVQYTFTHKQYIEQHN